MIRKRDEAMKLETTCSAIVYTMKYGNAPRFLVEQKGMGPVSVPDAELYVKEKEKETDRAVITGKTSLAVRLDTVFCDGAWHSSAEGIRTQKVYYLAQTVPEEETDWDTEELGLYWKNYQDIVRSVKDESVLELIKHAMAYLAVKYELENPVKEFGYIWYREHAVDIHSHIIPGADDGSKSIHETMELLDLDWAEGMRTVFATPHYGEENGYDPERHEVLAGFDQIMKSLKESVRPVEVRLGTEWYCSEHIVERIRNQDAFPMGDSDWYMVEFLEWGNVTESADDILRRLKMMKDNGIRTILAHPERYRAIQKDWDLAKRICDLDVRLQVNAYDLFLNPKDTTRNLAQWMAKEELISFLGSDMHGTRPGKRGPRMKEGISWLYENVDYEYANDVVRRNAETLLGVDRLL